MTPRIALQAVPVSAALDDVLSRFTTGRHYRLLVYADSLDDISGPSTCET
jgi:Mg2+/Co2+ transporter CorB